MKRSGEQHHNAKLSDDDVELMRRLKEAGLSLRAIARKFDSPKSTVAMICRYERRAC